MRRVAVATCSVPGIDEDQPLLLAALAERGLEAEARAWDDPGVAWAAYDLVVVRSTWDYATRRQAFLAWARSVPRIANPYRALEWSSDKHYLVELAGRGVPVVETRVLEPGDAVTAADLPEGDVVVKPAVGAGSIDAARYRAGDEAALGHVVRLHEAGRAVLVQPYVASVDERGERALIFIDGRFSHAMTKAAMLNTPEGDRTRLFRVEQMSLAKAEPDAVALAESILGSLDLGDLLYGRVDLVAGEDGWRVMEVEVVEPSLFLGYHPPAADALAAGVVTRFG